MRHEDEAVLHVIQKGIIKILERLNRMSEAQDALVAAANRQDTVDASIIALLNQVVQELKDSANDPAAVLAVAARIQANNDAIAAAVTANTPAAPAPAAAKA